MDDKKTRRRRRRRRHVPAFGEWNYSYVADEPSEAWIISSYPGPPAAESPVKARRPAGGTVAAPDCTVGEKGRGLQLEEAASRRFTRASDSGGAAAAATPAKAATTTAMRMRRPVIDADLYRVPPPDFASQRPRKRVVRSMWSMWMGCLGLHCVACIN